LEEKPMAMTTALTVYLSGEMPQPKLEKMRQLLGLTKRGRLDDDEDANFGYRNIQRDEANQIIIDLYRDTSANWHIALTYRAQPPAPGTVDQLRTDILAAAGQVGVGVDRVVQRNQQPDDS
jgi:hypothetical protein